MKISRQALVPYSPEQMFALVEDVKAYPEFLPEISSVRVLEANDEAILAEIEVRKGPVRESFSTRNRRRPPEWMSMELVKGPFRHLYGEWSFRAEQNGTRVVFDLNFEVKGRALRMILEPVVGKMADKLVERFHRRAEVVYG